MPRTIYLDYNATTPLDPAVRAEMLPYLETLWGNPSSVHHLGRRARARLDDARERAARVLGAKPSEITFTSGGTEANNQAILGAARRLKSRGRHLITSTVEHHAVLHSFDYLEAHEGFAVTRVGVDASGRVDLEAVRAALQPDTVLVSIMAANNEIGTLQPVAEIGALCRERGVMFHTDAVQSFGKQEFKSVHQFNADLVPLCAHKFHGPKGAGLLWVRSPFHPEPLLWGGGHEQEQRAGTENVAGILGLVAAMERFVTIPVFPEARLREFSTRLAAVIRRLPGCEVLSPAEGVLSNTVAFVTPGVDSMTLLAGLDLAGICASGGAACSSGSLEPSHVVTALGRPAAAASLVRFSLGRDTKAEEVAEVERVLPELVRRAQAG